MIPGLAIGLVAGVVALGLAGWGAGVLAGLVAVWGVIALRRWRLVAAGALGLLGLALAAGLTLGAGLVGAGVGFVVWFGLAVAADEL